VLNDPRLWIDGAFALGVIVLLIKTNQDVSKANQANAEKVGRVYKRLDECKTHVEEFVADNYVHKDVFKLEIDHMDKDFARLEKKIDGMDRKLDKLIERNN
jgi:regulator of replication initiation timing